MPNPVIDVRSGVSWKSWHSTSGVGGPVARLFIPWNDWDDNSPSPADQPYAAGLAGLQAIVRQSEARGTRLRALGSGWSLGNIAYVPEDLVDTSNLSSLLVGFGPTYVAAGLQAASEQLVFVQGGTPIKNLNNELARRGLALPTAGASNGQTIAGAISTGTHGAANAVGSIPDYVLGLHIVAEGGRDYWIERASRPAMSDQFVAWLGARLVRDDDLFLSAVVSFGSFGLIHAVVLQAEPMYLLQLVIKPFDFDQVVHAATTLDVGALGLPDGAALPFHFEVVLNPYKRQPGGGGAFVRALSKRPFVAPGPSPSPTDGAGIRSADLVSVAAALSNIAPSGIIGDILQGQLNDSFSPTGAEVVTGTPGTMFGDAQPTSGGTSMEIGIPLARVDEALETIFSVADSKPFGAPLGLRYVKASDALLGFTCFAPVTCAIEIPGVDSSSARDAHALIWSALDAAGIPHTFHWGQQAPFTTASILAGFGAGRRAFLRTPAGRRMFSSDLLDACGLST